MEENKYRILLNSTSDSGYTITIPLFRTLDENLHQEESINTNFLDTEIENNINQILNWDKARFSPYLASGCTYYYNGGSLAYNSTTNQLLDRVEFRLNFLNSIGSYYSTSFTDSLLNIDFNGTSYTNIGFVEDDYFYSRNNLKKSFLRLSFYDSDNVFKQNLLFDSIIYPNIKYQSDVSLYQIPVRMIAIDPIKIASYNFTNTHLSSNSEGFFIYDYYSDIEITGSTIPKEIFMKAEFNNAKTGKKTVFMNNSNTINIGELTNNTNFFTKFILAKTLVNGANEYIYYADTSYSSNVIYTKYHNTGLNEDILAINLYQLNVS